MVCRFNPNLNKPLTWFSHEEGKYFIEARMNFDWKNTAAILMGKTFSKKPTFWITPKVGFLFGFNSDGYNGFSPEINCGGAYKAFHYFAMNQCALSFGGGNPSFYYEYTQLGYNTKYFNINCAFQFFKSLVSHTDVYIDIGPQVFIPIQKFYIKPWYTIDPGHVFIRKFVIGVGYHF